MAAEKRLLEVERRGQGGPFRFSMGNLDFPAPAGKPLIERRINY